MTFNFNTLPHVMSLPSSQCLPSLPQIAGCSARSMSHAGYLPSEKSHSRPSKRWSLGPPCWSSTVGTESMQRSLRSRWKTPGPPAKAESQRAVRWESASLSPTRLRISCCAGDWFGAAAYSRDSPRQHCPDSPPVSTGRGPAKRSARIGTGPRYRAWRSRCGAPEANKLCTGSNSSQSSRSRTPGICGRHQTSRPTGRDTDPCWWCFSW